MRHAGEPARFERHGLVVLDHLTAGPATGTPVVLVHGIGVGATSFARIAPLLAVRGPVHTLELPGFGRAPKPPEALPVEDLGGLLALLLESIGRPALLLGHSMGAQVVAEAALRVPHLVERVVLVGPVTDPEERSAVMQGIRLVQDTVGEPPATNLAVFSKYLQCGPRRYLATMPSMLDYGTEAVVARLTVPVLVIRGGRDPIARRPWARRVAAAAAVGRLVEVPGARHVVMHSHPRATAAAVLQAGP